MKKSKRVIDSDSALEQQPQQVYEVEKILEKRKINGVDKYKIKWVGWDGPNDLTWEPIEHLCFVTDLVEQFEEQLRKNKEAKKGSRSTKGGKKAGEQMKRREKMPEMDIEQRSPQEQNSPQMEIERKKPSIDIEQILPHEDACMRIEEEAPVWTMQGKYGVGVKAINRFIFKDGRLFCDVDVMNEDKICVGVRLIEAEQVKKQQPDMMISFMEEYLIEVQERRKI